MSSKVQDRVQHAKRGPRVEVDLVERFKISFKGYSTIQQFDLLAT